jgi:hypothetical protein
MSPRYLGCRTPGPYDPKDAYASRNAARWPALVACTSLGAGTMLGDEEQPVSAYEGAEKINYRHAVVAQFEFHPVSAAISSNDQSN